MARRRKGTSGDLFTLRCDTCGKPLARTSGDYLACPDGHGGLHLAAPDTAGILADSTPEPQPDPSWFDTDSAGDGPSGAWFEDMPSDVLGRL